MELDGVIEILLWHRPSGLINSRIGVYYCECDDAVNVPGGFDVDGFAVDQGGYERAIAAHQASRLIAANG